MFSYLKYMLKNEDHLYLKINATIKTKQNIYPYSGILFDKEKKRSIDRYQSATTWMNLEKVLFYMK